MHHLDTQIFDWVESFGWPADAVIRLLLAALCGGLVGLEREVRGRQAGFRTNLLVCLGSAIAMVVSTRFAYFKWPDHPGFGVTVDPARVAYGVMAGIGFLGAGAIIKTDGAVRGLTTAAGLWCVTAIGLAAGFGLYLFVVFATALVLAALWGLDYVEEILPRAHYRTVTLRRSWEPGCARRMVEQLRGLGYTVADWTYERTPDPRSVDVHVRIAFTSRQEYDELETRLPTDEPCELVAVREA